MTTNDDLGALDARYMAAIEAAGDIPALEEVRVAALGKKGDVSLKMRDLGGMSPEERKVFGPALNGLKDRLTSAIEAKKAALEAAALNAALASERVDITLPAPREPKGSLHPVSQVMEELAVIFADMGFAVAEGPDVEDDFHNFTALNFPADHPARDTHDTFFMEKGADGTAKLLRTHTSPVQIRYLENNPPPVRVIAPGRVYRRDAVDATHSPVFHQVEVLAIDEGLDFTHLRGTVTTFLQRFFGDLPVRFRASYFPFTEPSAEVDVQWRGRWLEVMGCGMVDPAVLTGMGLDPERWSGFAAGLGVERFCMVRHGIDDIRRLYTSDLRFLEQF